MMDQHVAAVSENTLEMFSEREGPRTLKQMYILYDRIVFAPGYVEGDTHQVIASVAGDNHEEARRLLQDREFRDAVILADDVFTKQEWVKSILELAQHVHVALIERLQVGPPSMQKLLALPDFFYGDTMRDIARAELVRKKFKYGGGILADAHRRFINVASRLGVSLDDALLPSKLSGPHKVMAPAILDRIAMPDFGALPWAEILELRKDKFVRHFRNRVAQMMRGTSTDEGSKVEITQAIDFDLWNLVEDATPPDLPMRLAKIGLTALRPKPFEWLGEAAHAALESADFFGGLSSEPTYGWLFFLQRSRRRSFRPADNSDQ